MEQSVIVIDIPEHVSAEEASRTLSVPDDSYMLVNVIPALGVHRAYFRRYSKSTLLKADAAKSRAEIAGNSALSRALMTQWLAENPKMSSNAIKTQLQKAGCGKGDKAIRELRTEIQETSA